MSFQIEWRTSDRLIVGIGINDDNTFPPDWPPNTGDEIATLDDSQFDAVLIFESAYLCADGQTVGGQPC